MPNLSIESTVAVDAPRADLGLRNVESRERVRVERRPELGERHPECEVRRGRREEVAAVECSRHRFERVVGVRELVRLCDAAELVRRRDQQTVVRPDMNAARAVAQRERAPRAADARVDDRKMHALGHERQRVRERQRTLQDGLRRDAVRDVDDLDIGRDPFDHAVTGADEIVLQAEVRQERDEARHAAAESTRAATSWSVPASATTSSPASRAASVVWGPIVIAGRRGPTLGQRPSRRRRREQDEVSCRAQSGVSSTVR